MYPAAMTEPTDPKRTGRPPHEGPEPLQMTAYVKPEVHEQFRVAAARYRTTISAYVNAAMEDFIAAGGLSKPPPPLDAPPEPAAKPKRKR